MSEMTWDVTVHCGGRLGTSEAFVLVYPEVKPGVTWEPGEDDREYVLSIPWHLGERIKLRSRGCYLEIHPIHFTHDVSRYPRPSKIPELVAARLEELDRVWGPR
jgi:hypothetical protein